MDWFFIVLHLQISMCMSKPTDSTMHQGRLISTLATGQLDWGLNSLMI